MIVLPGNMKFKSSKVKKIYQADDVRFATEEEVEFPEPEESFDSETSVDESPEDQVLDGFGYCNRIKMKRKYRIGRDLFGGVAVIGLGAWLLMGRRKPQTVTAQV